MVMKMKKGISIWAFSDPDLKANMKKAKDLGFDGIELALDETGVITPDMTKETADDIVAYAKEIGIELYSVATGLYWDYSLSSDDEAMRSKAFETAKAQIRVASWLGCETILLVAGAVKVNFIPNTPTVDYVTAYERICDAVKALIPTAEKYNVKIAIENVGNMLLMSPIEMREFIDKMNSPYVVSYFDVGNALWCGCPEHWIRGLGKRIDKVHFKDYAMVNDVYEIEVDLLRGNLDYVSVMKALEDIGYDGWATAEVFPYRVGNEVMLEHTARAMDYILNELEY